MLVEINSKQEKMPDFLIVGAQRAGTSSLYYYLLQHPQIYMSPVKELHFFSYIDKPEHIRNLVRDRWRERNVVTASNLNNYISFFKNASDKQIIGEVSPSYLYHYKDTINAIKRMYGKRAKELKIIISLRNPIERAFSALEQATKTNKEELDLIPAIEHIPEKLKQGLFGLDYIGHGKYYESVKAYMENFEHVAIILVEELKEKPYETIRYIFEFLGIKKDFLPDISLKLNPSGIPKNRKIFDFVNKPNIVKRFLKNLLPAKIRIQAKAYLLKHLLDKTYMKKHEREYLIGVYKDDIKNLQSLIQKNLSAWLK